MYQRILYTFYVFSYGLGGLFIYTATKKVKDYTSYAAHIEASQLFTTAVSPWVATSVIAIEVLLAFVLIMPIAEEQIWAWRIVFLLMLSYSYYIYYILKKAPFVPCACKAVYEQLGRMGPLPQCSYSHTDNTGLLDVLQVDARKKLNQKPGISYQ